MEGCFSSVNDYASFVRPAFIPHARLRIAAFTPPHGPHIRAAQTHTHRTTQQRTNTRWLPSPSQWPPCSRPPPPSPAVARARRAAPSRSAPPPRSRCPPSTRRCAMGSKLTPIHPGHVPPRPVFHASWRQPSKKPLVDKAKQIVIIRPPLTVVSCPVPNRRSPPSAPRFSSRSPRLRPKPRAASSSPSPLSASPPPVRTPTTQIESPRPKPCSCQTDGSQKLF